VCTSPRYVGMSGQCTCGGGYYGRVVYVSGQLSGCVQCLVNAWALPGNGNTGCSPIPCTPSSNFTGASGSCMCNAGYYGSVKYVNGNATGCVACGNSNVWSSAGNGRVCMGISCNSVGFTGLAGNCMCAAGFTGSVTYSLGYPLGCSPCPSNQWSVAGTDQPCINITCSKSPGYEGDDGFCICSAGYYEVSPVSYSSGYPVGCAKCQPGAYSSAPSQKVCSLCPKGKYSSVIGATNSSVCLDCMPGFYSDQNGLAACSSCESGKYSEALSSSSCSLCPKGKYSSSLAASDSSTCLDCVAGYYANNDGFAFCLRCESGKYSPPGSTICSLCDKGAFSSVGGSAACTLCPSGSFE
jgi:hypothetical protein